VERDVTGAVTRDVDNRKPTRDRQRLVVGETAVDSDRL
jgi:hypothetical protein